MSAKHFEFAYGWQGLSIEDGLVTGRLEIFKQDPEIVKNFLNKAVFTASNGWTIRVSCYPEISAASKRIYIQGSTKDWNVSPKFLMHLEVFQNVSQTLREFCDFKLHSKRGHLLTTIFKDEC